MNFQVTTHIDLVLVALYSFWIFFGCLIFYLHREGKREGYPLISENPRGGLRRTVGFPGLPSPKTFALSNGETVTVPNSALDPRQFALRPLAVWEGAPQEPTGNPMRDGVGPASYAMRSDHPDLTIEGHPKIVPLRVATDYFVAEQDPDPRGMVVKGADAVIAGTVSDVWVDRSEYIARYYEVALENGRTVLLPSNFARVDARRREIRVKAILAAQFADVPQARTPDQVTLLEEDRICGYFGGGYLYATPGRTESML